MNFKIGDVFKVEVVVTDTADNGQELAVSVLNASSDEVWIDKNDFMRLILKTDKDAAKRIITSQIESLQKQLEEMEG